MKKHNARNDLPARVVAIKRGDVMSQVDVVLAGSNTISMGSESRL